MSETGMVFDIQRTSVHDGPGIRTTVFLKGCNLRCFWCHNPESWRADADLLFYPTKCIGCGKCLAACPWGCHSMTPAGGHAISREKCTQCGACVKKCYPGALVLSGRERSVEDVMKTVRADAAFYQNSGGGVTVSGGEPLLQPEFTLALLKAAKEENIHTALDTAGHVAFSVFERVSPYVDLLLFDCKCMDSTVHKQATGAGNERILENLRRLGQGSTPVWVRVPVIPGVNDMEQNMTALREFLSGLPAVQRLDLLTYHNLGAGKHANLGGEYAHKELKAPPKERMAELAGCFAGAGYEVNA
ncbi:MAG: glycyl-radical enzyme activating protein [Oscillospiraceae bacterium]|nr:glycyl-radical enzyme activating protein [Oscillospiraceae bacterium]